MTRNREREQIRAHVSAYLDGELPPDDAMYVGRMIAEDARYARTYEAYRSIRTGMRAMPRPEVPVAVSNGIRAYTAAHPHPPRPVVSLRTRVARVTAAAATLAATIVAIFTGGFGLTPRFAQPGFGPYAQATISAPAQVRVGQGQSFATLVNTRLDYNEPLEIKFSGAMDDKTVRDGVVFSPSVPKQNLLYNPNSFILSTAPNALKPDTQYQVSILKGLKDTGGNEVKAESFGFTVGPAPVIAPPPVAPTATVASTVVAAALPTEKAEPVVTATTAPVATLAPVATATVADDDATATTPRATPRPANTTAPRATATVPPAAPTAAAPTAPAATATIAPTAPRPTNTAVPAATATAVPATATPAPTVTPTTPAIPVAGRFAGAYEQTANRLGAPTGVVAPVSGGTSLTFDKGIMVYVPGRSFYVIYPGGRWSSVANPGGSGKATPASNGGFVPGGPFGAAWTNAKLQDSLGYATAQQESGYAGSIQQFENGIILAVGGDVYVLLNGGAYVPFSA